MTATLAPKPRTSERPALPLEGVEAPASSHGLTIVVPALNEELNVVQAVEELLSVLADVAYPYEIILVNDGSRDRTGPLMEDLARGDPRMRVVHHAEARGLGWIFHETVRVARYDHMTMVAGDRTNTVEGLRRLFGYVGSADLVVGYRTDMRRTLSRTVISQGFQLLANVLFGFGQLRDWTGMFIWPVKLVRQLGSLPTNNTYSVYVLVALLRKSISVRQVPVSQTPDLNGSSKIVSLKTVAHVLDMIWRLKVRPGR